jgi:formamidopyrimidine-DNA glycosylase
MPELPEVETMRRGILPIVGGRISDCGPVACRRKPILIAPKAAAFRKRAVGRTVAAVDRIGKRVVIRLDGGDAVVIEPRMTGLVLVTDPPSEEHLRFRIELAESGVPEVWYWDRRGLGSVRLFSSAELAAAFGPDKFGPDALALSVEELRARLRRSRREIKVALLDQKAVLGIGNLYASEILHLAQIHPQKRCDQLRVRDWETIHARMREVLEEAILHEGSTLGDGTYRNALNQAGGYQNHHRVYARAGEVCKSCARGEIVRIVQAQRSTFFCPQCQRKSGRRNQPQAEGERRT